MAILTCPVTMGATYRPPTARSRAQMDTFALQVRALLKQRPRTEHASLTAAVGRALERHGYEPPAGGWGATIGATLIYDWAEREARSGRAPSEGRAIADARMYLIQELKQLGSYTPTNVGVERYEQRVREITAARQAAALETEAAVPELDADMSIEETGFAASAVGGLPRWALAGGAVVAGVLICKMVRG